MNELNDYKYRGIIPPMITPLTKKKSIDHVAVEKIIDHLLIGGVNGLFILGSTGEAQSLSYKLRQDLILRVCKYINNRKPILVGITDTSIEESLKLAEYAYKSGAHAVVSAPPYYYACNQEELVSFYTLLADELPLPLFLYNMPTHTKVNFNTGTIEKLSKHKNIIGLKDSSGDLIYFQKIIQLLKEKPVFTLLTGPEELLMQSILSGAHGGVSGGANMFPGLYVAMYEASVGKNFERMSSLQEKIIKISSSIYSIGNSPAKYLQGVKCALSLMGICNDTMAPPYTSFGNKERELVRKSLEKLNIEEVLT